MTYSHLSKKEVIALKQNTEKSIVELNDRIVILKDKLEQINTTINYLNKKNLDNIALPQKLIHTPGINNSEKPKYEWKNKIERCLKLNEHLLTCRMIFNFLKKEDDWCFIADREAIKNISSALTYLERDGKIKKIKLKDNEAFFYGNTFLHFDLDGKPRKSLSNYLQTKIAT